MVLTGAGGKAFVSGADISKFKDERQEAEAVAHYQATTQKAHWRCNTSQADHRHDPRLLHRRRHGGGGVLRPAHLLRQFEIRRSGRQARPRLRPQPRPAAGRPHRPGLRQGNVLHRAPVRRARGREDGAREPRRRRRPARGDDRRDDADDRRQRAAHRALRQARRRRSAEGFAERDVGATERGRRLLRQRRLQGRPGGVHGEEKASGFTGTRGSRAQSPAQRSGGGGAPPRRSRAASAPARPRARRPSARRRSAA